MLAREHIPPLLSELFPIDLLIAFKTVSGIGSGSPAPVVDHGRLRLVDSLESQRANAETKVDVFVVSRRISFVETTRCFKQILSHQQ